jgi:hypothetical protein
MKPEELKAEALKAEGLSAMVGPSMRPSALEAATSPAPVTEPEQRDATPSKGHVSGGSLSMSIDG